MDEADKVAVSAAMKVIETGAKATLEHPSPETSGMLLGAAIEAHEILATHFGLERKFEKYLDVVALIRKSAEQALAE